MTDRPTDRQTDNATYRSAIADKNDGVVGGNRIQRMVDESAKIAADTIFDIIKHMSELKDDEAAMVPSFSNSADDTDYYENLIMDLTIKTLSLQPNTKKKQRSNFLCLSQELFHSSPQECCPNSIQQL